MFPPKNQLERPLPARRPNDESYDPAVGARAVIDADDALSAQEQRMFISLDFTRKSSRERSWRSSTSATELRYLTLVLADLL